MATVNLSVKNVPAKVADGLKARAERNHRSLQGELMVILEEAAREVSVADLVRFAERVGLSDPAGESLQIVKGDRRGRRR
jgi:plasmid stability protein